MRVRDRPDRGVVGALSEQIHRENDPRLRRPHACERRRIQVHPLGLDVGEDGAPPGVDDRAGCGEEGEGRQNHVNTRSHAEGLQGEQEGVGSGGDGDGVADAEAGGELLLESLDLRPPDPTAGCENPFHRVEDRPA